LQSLHDAEVEAKCCQDEIDRLQARLITLRIKQQRAYQRIDHLRACLAPIRRLPPEILGRVFSFCSPRSGIDHKGKIYCPVVRLSQVCAGWRKIAQETPSLWSSLSIRLQSQPMTYAIQRMLELHLELSKQHPLFLDLTLTHSAEGAVGVLKSLVQHCSRWE
ncbi:hypothetical protein K435DRAFT_567354, partial [Dendrothele bispora CBS 962.96]